MTPAELTTGLLRVAALVAAFLVVVALPPMLVSLSHLLGVR